MAEPPVHVILAYQKGRRNMNRMLMLVVAGSRHPTNAVLVRAWPTRNQSLAWFLNELEFECPIHTVRTLGLNAQAKKQAHVRLSPTRFDDRELPENPKMVDGLISKILELKGPSILDLRFSEVTMADAALLAQLWTSAHYQPRQRKWHKPLDAYDHLMRDE